MKPLVGRFAPSPTGVLHLGNARSLLLAWLSIRSAGGQMLMRIEDLDGPRIKPGAEGQCLHDLEWLGLDWDGPVVRQSERQELYTAALQQLLAQGDAYPCTCSRREVERAASAPHQSEEGPVYPGTCRDPSAAMVASPAKATDEPAFRFRTAPGAVCFDDIFQGSCTYQVQQELGDFVIHKRDGQAAYQLAVVVDDAAMGITEVLRGVDLLSSAARQQQLAQALSLSSPRWCHVPLVVGKDGRRLAKRHGDTSLRALREAGVAAEEVVGWLAWSCGLQQDATPCRAEDLVADFAVGKVPPEDVVWQGELKAPMRWRAAATRCRKPPHTADHNRS